MPHHYAYPFLLQFDDKTGYITSLKPPTTKTLSPEDYAMISTEYWKSSKDKLDKLVFILGNKYFI